MRGPALCGASPTACGICGLEEVIAKLSAVRIEVDTINVISSQRVRDDHLSEPDSWTSGEFPRMVFAADSACRTGDRSFEIAGQLQPLAKPRH